MDEDFRHMVRTLVTVRPFPSRLFYIPYLLVAGWCVAGAMGMDESPQEALPYVVLSVVLLAQVLRPSLVGWFLSLLAWLAVCFLGPLYWRIVEGRAEYTSLFLFLWGVLPVLVMLFLRPRLTKRHRRGGDKNRDADASSRPSSISQ
jgi:hypothetical protein